MKPKSQLIAVLSSLLALAAMNALADPRPEDVPSQEPVIGAPGVVDGGDGTPTQQPDQQPGQQPGQNPGSCAALLVVDKEGPEPSAFVGETIKYRIAVTNLADCDASGVDVVDTLPEDAAIIEISPAATSIVGGQVTWAGQTIAAGATHNFEVQVMYRAPGEDKVNTACASQGLDPEVCDTVITDIVEQGNGDNI